MPPRCQKRKQNEDGEPSRNKSKRQKTSRRKKQDAPSSAADEQAADQARPSDNWTPSKNEEVADAVNGIVATANWGFLCSEAEKHHPSGLKCTADLTKYTHGLFNAVFELSFSDGSYWIARIGLDPLPGDEKSDPEYDMLTELATMRVVKERSSIPVPTVFTYNSQKSNPFGYPYMLMSVIPGKVLPNRLALAVPPEQQPKVAGQLARYVWELSQISFDQTGGIWCGHDLDEDPQIRHVPCISGEFGPFNSSTSDLSTTRKRVTDAIERSQWPEATRAQWKSVCAVFTKVIPTLICPDFRRGPFPLFHLDLHRGNILFDDDFNIQGIIDWSRARVVPVELFVDMWDIRTRPELSEASNRRVLEFRSHFVAAYRRLEETSTGRGLHISHLFESRLPDAAFLWDSGEDPEPYEVMEATALRLLKTIYGDETTLKNWMQRKRKHCDRGFRAGLSRPARKKQRNV